MMHLLRICCAVLLGLSTGFTAFSQGSNTAIGQWRTYIPNNHARSVAVAGDKIYCATDKGLFFVDKAFNSIQTLSKTDGLHDIGISTLEYDPETATVLVAFQNTNLDLIKGDNIININDILRKEISGVKTINHIYFKNKLAYLSCSFGLVVLDMVKLEIRDSYIFQNTNGSIRQVYAATILNDQIFVATSSGLMVARNSRTVNLNDLKNWTLYGTNSGLPAAGSDNFRTLATFNNAVFAGVNREGVYKLNSGTNSWSNVVGTPGNFVNQLTVGRDGLIIATNLNFRVYDAAGNTKTYNDNLISFPVKTVQDRDGIFWSADVDNGLIRTEGNTFESIIPNGPASEAAFRIWADNESVLVTAGGYSGPNQLNSKAGFYEFKNGIWENFNYKRFNDPAKYPDIQDLTDVIRNPVTGKVFFSSFGYGLMEWSGPGNFKTWNLGNSPLNSSITGSPQYVRLTDITADENGNIWVVNPSDFASLPSIHVLQTDYTWKSFSLIQASNGTFTNENVLEKIVIDDNGYKWITVKPRNGSGLVVFDDVNNRLQYLNSNPTTGNLPGNQVYSIIKDRNGEIWVGTEDGIGVFFDPSAVFGSSRTIAAHTPVIGNRPLLEGQIVRCMAVDGANRKWVGTETGLWLFNEDGDEVIHNFTDKNSPLPSNKIQDIAVNHATGDVFISTEAGLVSYRAGATITEKKLDCANVYPNPVRPGYTGQIAVSGIANNGPVKITDITGTLVYETKSLGGTAIWNGRDYNGNRVRSGVYLVLSSNPEGGETCISKVAVLE